MKTNKPTIDNVHIKVDSHPSGGKDYCLLTLCADFDGKTYSESITVFSKYLFDEINEVEREAIFQDVISKLSSDLLNKYYGFSKNVQKNINPTHVLKQMRKFYEI